MNWLEAQQTIFFGKQVIDTILIEEPTVNAGTRWMLIEFGNDGWGKKIEEYIPENRKELFEKVMGDINKAKLAIYNT